MSSIFSWWFAFLSLFLDGMEGQNGVTLKLLHVACTMSSYLCISCSQSQHLVQKTNRKQKTKQQCPCERCLYVISECGHPERLQVDVTIIINTVLMCWIILWHRCEAQSTLCEALQQYTTKFNNVLHISHSIPYCTHMQVYTCMHACTHACRLTHTHVHSLAFHHLPLSHQVLPYEKHKVLSLCLFDHSTYVCTHSVLFWYCNSFMNVVFFVCVPAAALSSHELHIRRGMCLINNI